MFNYNYQLAGLLGLLAAILLLGLVSLRALRPQRLPNLPGGLRGNLMLGGSGVMLLLNSLHLRAVAGELTAVRTDPQRLFSNLPLPRAGGLHLLAAVVTVAILVLVARRNPGRRLKPLLWGLAAAATVVASDLARLFYLNGWWKVSSLAAWVLGGLALGLLLRRQAEHVKARRQSQP